MALFGAAVAAVLTSLWLVALTIRGARRFGVGVDRADGVLKLHVHWVPRLGGIAIFVALASSMLILAWASGEHQGKTAALIVCFLPAFGIGLLEDLTEKAGVLVRLVFTMVAAALGWWLIDARLTYLDFELLDGFLASGGIAAFALTLIAASGLAHAINIVDGCNGLSSFVAMVVLGAIAIVAMLVGDEFVATTAVLGVASLLGFFVWNFPMGRIFMGDAGAYLVGFLIAELSILLVRHNPEVSPWFPMLLMAYPVWETLYSMYRRGIVHGSSMGQPDKLHLHQLIYYRLVRTFMHSSEHRHQAVRSSLTSTYLWAVTLLCALPALYFWDSTPALKTLCVLFIGGYLLFHTSLVRFRAPRLLILRNLPFARPALPEPEEEPAE